MAMTHKHAPVTNFRRSSLFTSTTLRALPPIISLSLSLSCSLQQNSKFKPDNDDSSQSSASTAAAAVAVIVSHYTSPFPALRISADFLAATTGLRECSHMHTTLKYCRLTSAFLVAPLLMYHCYVMCTEDQIWRAPEIVSSMKHLVASTITQFSVSSLFSTKTECW